MSINFTKLFSIARAVLDVVGAGALVAISYIVYSRIRSNPSSDGGGEISPGSVVKDNQAAIDGLDKALAALRAASGRSGN